MKRTSLNRIFTVALTLFTICVIVAVSWFFNHQENFVLLGAMKRHANSLAENLASKSEYPLWFKFYPEGVVDDSLKALVEETAQDKDVQFAAIFSKSGETIVEQKLGQQSQKFQEHLQQVVQDILRLKTPFTYDFEDMYYILIPIQLAPSREADLSSEQPSTQAPKPKLLTFPDQSDLLGLAVVGFSLESVASVLQQMQVEIGGLALFIILLVVVLSRFLANTISDPIEQLAEGTQRIAQGDLTHEVQVNTANEIGDLADSFNQMMQDLRSSRKELELWTQTLEQRVKERTHEIQEKNARLTELVDKMAHMQEQLVHSEKMSSLGQLVAGIAHEINNPVNFISSNMTPLNSYIQNIKTLLKEYEDACRLSPEEHTHLTALKEEMDFDFLIDDLESLIQDIGSGAARIKRIVQDLRNFSRLDEAELKTIDLHQSLDTTLNLLGHLYENRITVYKEYGAISAIECYAGQLNQVFMNLLANAAQAFERKNKGSVWIKTWCEPPYIYIAIRDNGCGIPEDVLPKIFDPFFTTKDVGEGTGLGLSISHGIIEKHHGEITATSRVGEGTEFTIMIPQKLSKVRRSD